MHPFSFSSKSRPSPLFKDLFGFDIFKYLQGVDKKLDKLDRLDDIVGKLGEIVTKLGEISEKLDKPR